MQFAPNSPRQGTAKTQLLTPAESVALVDKQEPVMVDLCRQGARLQRQIFGDWAPSLRIRLLGLLLAMSALLAGCGERVVFPLSMVPVPLSKLNDGVITLSVAHVVNPRLEQFSAAQIAAFLDALRAASKTQLGREIEFEPVETFSIADYFNPVPASKHAWRKKYIVDFKKGGVDRQKLESAYELAINEQVAPLKDWAEFAAREIGLLKVDTDPSEWKRRLAKSHIDGLALLAKMKAADGKPVIDDSPYNEQLFWHALGERAQVHDLIITNQLVASVEYSGVDIHPALRGGLTNGTTSFARDAPFGLLTWWSTFAFTSNDPVIVSMRRGETYDPLEAARLAGTGAAHELGHMFFQYGHPFGLSACVMSPSPMLRFREWVEKLDPAACRAAQHPAMKPGAAQIRRPVYAADTKR